MCKPYIKFLVTFQAKLRYQSGSACAVSPASKMAKRCPIPGMARTSRGGGGQEWCCKVWKVVKAFQKTDGLPVSCTKSLIWKSFFDLSYCPAFDSNITGLFALGCIEKIWLYSLWNWNWNHEMLGEYICRYIYINILILSVSFVNLEYSKTSSKHISN